MKKIDRRKFMQGVLGALVTPWPSLIRPIQKPAMVRPHEFAPDIIYDTTRSYSTESCIWSVWDPQLCSLVDRAEILDIFPLG